MKRTLVVIALLAGTAPLLSGCSSTAAAASTTDSVVIIATDHQNAPTASVPVELSNMLEGAIANKAALTVIGLDGTPSVAWHAGRGSYVISDASDVAKNADIQTQAAQVVSAVSALKADSNGDNLLSALSVASDQLKADGATHGQIIVLDSGLSDTGWLDMTSAGITLADPQSLVTLATQAGQLPSFPSDTAVTLVGFGYTAAPQVDLSAKQRANVNAIWQQLLTAAGATVTVLPDPVTGASPTTSYTTKTVAADSSSTVTTVTSGNTSATTVSSDALFDAGAWTLRADAQSALNQVRSHITNTNKVTITGYTDVGAQGSVTDQELGQRRADAVAAWLVAAGVPSGNIQTVSKGHDQPVVANPTTDAERALNRRVVITVVK